LSAIANKLKQWFFGNEFEPEDEDFDIEEIFDREQEQQEEEEHQKPSKKRRSELRVVSHQRSTKFEVMVTEPKTFEESLEIVNSLRDRKSIILNLHLLDAEQSQRVVDFISGATHAIDGHQQRIGEGVFIFTPNNVSISAETEKAKVLKEALWGQVL
jgi:FtsZ-interacting cell division protein YlmF